MKKIGEYTCRGSIRTDNAVIRIILDDGQFDTGYKIVEFEIAAHDMDNLFTNLYTAKLLTDDDTSTGVNWNWDDNAEIAWSIFGFDGNQNTTPNYFSRTDPDNLVIQDLFIRADEANGNDMKINYYIRMEKYDITDSQGVLAMVRNRSQA